MKNKNLRKQFEKRKLVSNDIKARIQKAKVIKIGSNFIEVEFKDESAGICWINEVSDLQIYDLNDYFKIDGEYDFFILNYHPIRKIYNLSYKMVHPEELYNKIRPVPTASHSRNLHKFLFSKLYENTNHNIVAPNKKYKNYEAKHKFSVRKEK